NRADADRLAGEAVARNLAVCVQIDGPIVSHFRWEGRDRREEEFRLCFKVLASHASALEQHVLSQHSYAVPEWILVHPARVGEKYLSWARTSCETPPL